MKKISASPKELALPACEKLGVTFAKEGAFWKSKIKGVVVLTYRQEGACKRNTEKYLTAHDGYYARLWV